MQKLTKKYPCIESTIEMECSNIKIRMWIDEDDLIPSNYESVIHNIHSFIFEVGTNERIEIINFIAKEVPRINAVQIVDLWGSVKFGTVAYTVNFGEDVHG